MSFLDRTATVAEGFLNLAIFTKLLRQETVDHFRKSGLLGPPEGSSGKGPDNPFSIQKELKALYSGRALLEPEEKTVYDDFVNSLAWWERLEFTEKFGDYDTSIPAPVRGRTGQPPPAPMNEMARNLRACLNEGKVITASTGQVTYCLSQIKARLTLQMRLFKKDKLNPCYDLFLAAEKVKGATAFIKNKLPTTDLKALNNRLAAWINTKGR